MFNFDLGTFGEWLKSTRRAHDLTQKELAQRVSCTEITIRKIEADELRPSKRLTALIMVELQVPEPQREMLLHLARQGH